nr:MAG TPA: hypothetical protein [Caudoviricetes sp.]DAH93869.1 MAG TPA: hypothetical protein [Caudoviricetes sp.]
MASNPIAADYFLFQRKIPAIHCVNINNFLLSGQNAISLGNHELEGFILTSLFRPHKGFANHSVNFCYRFLSFLYFRISSDYIFTENQCLALTPRSLGVFSR